MRSATLLLLLALALAFIPVTMAQEAPGGELPVSDISVNYRVDSGPRTNTLPTLAEAYSHVLQVPGAGTLRVFFERADLGPIDFIEVVGTLDGQVHRLDQRELEKWYWSSGYFNGDTVIVTLFLAPGSTGRFQVSHVLSGIAAIGPDSICGVDDRIASTDWRSARILTNSGGGCTGWLTGPDDCYFTAGHCSASTMVVAEFEVPPSQANGTKVSPPIDKQYPINLASVQYQNGGIGSDWSVGRLQLNNLGQSAAANYGWFAVNSFIPNPNDTMRITGYGTDDGAANQTNQTHTGPFAGNNGTQLQYAVDTTGGNSGSPVIYEATGEAVGIHTHAGCNSSGGANSGTSLSHPNFQATYPTVCSLGPPVAPTAAFTANPTSVAQGGTVNFSDASTGIPTSWAWDLDGDSLVDSVQQHPSFQYNLPGTYTVTLTATNAQGSDTLTVSNYITVTPITPVSLPYTQDFSGGLPGGGAWNYQSSNGNGRIITGSNGSASPVSGSPSMIMDSSVSNSYVTNDATLHVNMTGHSGAILTYWYKETADEDDPEDGVFLFDGTTEALAQSHNGGPQDWTQFTVDIGAVAAANGLILGPDLRVIFRQRDNYPIGTDGVLIDDIQIVSTAPGFTLVMSTSGGGVGDFHLELQNLPATTARGFTLFSLDTNHPVGQGVILGIIPDALTLYGLTTVGAPTNPFHWVIPFVPGVYPDGPLTAGPGVMPFLSGTELDGQGVALDAGWSILEGTNVVRITF